MLGVAGNAFQARARSEVVSGVQAFARPNAPGNFGVAIKALERALSGRDFVAGRAVRYAIDRLVRARQGAGRDLGGSRYQCPYHCQNNPPQKCCLRQRATTLREARV
jgi:hypothetical protein